jgi:hypothetical protein
VWPTPLYVGDWASFDVIPHLPDKANGHFTITVNLPGPDSDSGQTSKASVLTSTVFPQGLDHKPRARFYWAWEAQRPRQTPQITDTVWLTFSLLVSPEVSDLDLTDNQLLVPIDLRPRSALFPPASAAEWTFTETQGFRLYYLTHTAAERDLSDLVSKAAAAYEAMTGHADPHGMPFNFNAEEEPVDIYLLDRVIGQGGYASGAWVAVSYTDRHYAPRNLDLILRHELVHRLDDAVGCRAAPILLREGLAVYSAGGHYWLESLPRKAAALLQLGDEHYIPLNLLVENFYTHQHEIGYLEAGAVVAYVVELMGWEGVEDLCRASAAVQGTEEERLSGGLEEVMAMDLHTFEQVWLRWIGSLHPSAQEVALLRLDWELMETIRAYQARFDPGANFLLGILFSPAEAEARDLTANFTRRPQAPEAIALELLLVMAQDARQVKDLEGVRACVAAVNDALERGFPSTGLAADILAIVRATLARGYEPYRLIRNDDVYVGIDAAEAQRAAESPSYLVYALDYSAWPKLRILVAGRDDATWQVTGPQPGD